MRRQNDAAIDGLRMKFSLEFAMHRPAAAIALGAALVICATPLTMAQQAPAAPDAPMAPAPPEPPSPGQTLPAQLSPEQLQQLVAPIALYPDSLVAQILAGATYPTQIVEAERYLAQHPKWHGKKLAREVDKQDWDPSVKALTAFPSVLSDMDQNLSWTSELGDVNYNQPQDVMRAVQYMRQQAQSAGNLQDTPQQSVTDDNGDIAIAPANPDVVYVPVYDPEDVFGYSVGLWPGFDPWWGYGGPGISFGMGIGVSPFFGYGWGWNHWGCGWGPHPGLWFGGAPYMSRSLAFYNRAAFMHGNYNGYGGRGFVGGFQRGGRGFAGNRGFAANRGFAGNRGFGAGRPNLRGFGGHPHPGIRSGAFGGFSRGAISRGNAFRGTSSMHGGFGGGMRGGFGGGMRGGFGGGGMRGGFGGGRR